MQTYKIYHQCTTIETDKYKIFISQTYLFSYLLRGFNSSGVKTKTAHNLSVYYLTVLNYQRISKPG